MNEVRERYGPDTPLLDLDVFQGAPDSGLLPSTTCRIIGNIVDNAVHFRQKLVAVVAAVGEGKCDRGRNTAFLLADLGLDVIESRFPPEEFENRPLLYSKSGLPLDRKMDMIMETIIDPSPASEIPEPSRPTHGFWGVPPNDYRILEVFPSTTHLYGWVRCVEAGRPGNMELECHVDEGVPTVFFSQSFCAKQDLAHNLAEKHRGLAIDCHQEANDSILAKIEAFIRLS